MGADLSWDLTVCYSDFCTEINPDIQISLHTQDKLGTGLLELCRRAVSQTNAKKIIVLRNWTRKKFPRFL